MPMEANYGPDDGIRLLPEPTDDQSLFTSTATACYRVATLAGAHDPDRGLSTAMINGQRLANDLLRVSQIEDPEHGIYARMDTIMAATLATTFFATTADDESGSFGEAAEMWRHVAAEIEADTRRSARDAVTHPNRDVPDNPWDTEAE